MNLGRQVHVPATGLNCCPRCSNLSCLFPWWFHDTSPKHFPTAELQPRADRLRVHFNRMFNNTLLRTHAPFRSFTFLLNVGTELTEYNCQSVCEFVRSGIPHVPRQPARDLKSCPAKYPNFKELRNRMNSISNLLPLISTVKQLKKRERERELNCDIQ